MVDSNAYLDRFFFSKRERENEIKKEGKKKRQKEMHRERVRVRERAREMRYRMPRMQLVRPGSVGRSMQLT